MWKHVKPVESCVTIEKGHITIGSAQYFVGFKTTLCHRHKLNGVREKCSIEKIEIATVNYYLAGTGHLKSWGLLNFHLQQDIIHLRVNSVMNQTSPLRNPKVSVDAQVVNGLTAMLENKCWLIIRWGIDTHEFNEWYVVIKYVVDVMALAPRRVLPILELKIW